MPKRPERKQAGEMYSPEQMMEKPDYIEKYGNDKINECADNVLRLTREVRILLGQFYLYMAMTRSKSFSDLADSSDANAGVRIVIGSLLRTMIVSSAALFDEDQRTSNIMKTFKITTSPRHLEFFRRMHDLHGDIKRCDFSICVLQNYGRKIKTGKYKHSIISIAHLRRTHIAHFDQNPSENPNGKRAIMKDLARSIATSSFIVAELNYVVIGREPDIPALRNHLREQADGIVSTLIRGFRRSDIIATEDVMADPPVNAETS